MYICVLDAIIANFWEPPWIGCLSIVGRHRYQHFVIGNHVINNNIKEWPISAILHGIHIKNTKRVLSKIQAISYELYSFRNKKVLARFLKFLKFLSRLISRGRALKRLGAATAKALSARVSLVLALKV